MFKMFLFLAWLPYAFSQVKHYIIILSIKQGRKRPLDTPKRMIERREREGERDRQRKVEGEI